MILDADYLLDSILLNASEKKKSIQRCPFDKADSIGTHTATTVT